MKSEDVTPDTYAPEYQALDAEGRQLRTRLLEIEAAKRAWILQHQGQLAASAQAVEQTRAQLRDYFRSRPLPASVAATNAAVAVSPVGHTAAQPVQRITVQPPR